MASNICPNPDGGRENFTRLHGRDYGVRILLLLERNLAWKGVGRGAGVVVGEGVEGWGGEGCSTGPIFPGPREALDRH
jgi:hypothetical protein